VNIYLVFIVILFILAVSDLVVGVSNDAVNFLNSSIGSKAAPVKIILVIAALGVFIGTTFSGGMMEIARSGIIKPGEFYFSEIMIIFLAVMITDVVLLDSFNTFGLPTSTTVSLVFELLGAAVALSVIKINQSGDTAATMFTYINSGKALTIISGILVSVAIAFTVGMAVQFFTRLIFSFNYERYMKYAGGIYGGGALAIIIYFLLVKGARGASFMTPETVTWIENNTLKIILTAFAGFTVILQVLISAFKINVLKIVVLAGTFALAMAFAGNDLVNFIGVPLAGYDSYLTFISDPSLNPDTFEMDSLAGPVKTPTLFLLAAGIIMVITLFTSRKAKTVTKTEVSLARQDAGDERWSSTPFSRSVVHGVTGFSKIFNKIIPGKVHNFIDRRFTSRNTKPGSKKAGDSSSFDLLRASVNTIVASILIASGTSLKLPLSTTYVTFMVAMGTSLADRAWGRESAVYRVSGVLTVIGGWFFTAIIAFTAAFIIAVFLNWGGVAAILTALVAALFIVIRTNFIHKKQVEKQSKKDEFDKEVTLTGENILQRCNSSIISVTESVSKLFSSSIISLNKENRKRMKKVLKEVKELNQFTKQLKYNLFPTLKKLEEEYIETGQYYVQILDYLREVAHCLEFIAVPVYEHLDNNHPSLLPEQIKEMEHLNEMIKSYFDEIVKIMKKKTYKYLNNLIARQNDILDQISRMKKKQIRLVRSEAVGTRNTMLYLNLLSETKNLVLHTLNVTKAHRDFSLSDEINSGSVT
jgi:phosphate/sulfate permease